MDNVWPKIVLYILWNNKTNVMSWANETNSLHEKTLALLMLYKYGSINMIVIITIQLFDNETKFYKLFKTKKQNNLIRKLLMAH